MILASALALAALAFGHPIAVRPARDSTLARELTRAGLDQEAALDLDSALALYHAARRADSSDVVAEYRYLALRFQRFEYAALRDEYAASAAHWNPRGTHCWTPWLTRATELRETIGEVLRADPTGAATSCTAVLVAMTMRMPLADTTGLAMRLAAAHRAVRAMPAIGELWIRYAQLLEQAGESMHSRAVWQEGETAVGHPILRVAMSMRHVYLLLDAGDTTRARALQRAARAEAMRDGRRGVVATYLARVLELPTLCEGDGGERQIVDRLLALSASPGGWAVAEKTFWTEGKALIDGGQPLKALPILSRAATLADSVRVSDLQLTMRVLRGRAYAKAGRPAEAERDLQKALVAGESSALAAYRADAYHNLAHAYESEGRWPEAVRAIDRFVTLARPMDYSGPVVTSLLDAGEIRWEAGWHAAADVEFRKMVRAIDSTRGNYYYAGEYFERSGNLERARDYYARAVEEIKSDPAGFAGMSRVQSALGHADSAEAWARAHDARILNWQPLDVPMLPLTLAKDGRTAEAMRIAHTWAARQIAAGNVEGAALATLQVAQLLLDAGHPDSAVVETQRMDSIVKALNLPREAIRARVVRGTALVRLGRSAAGVRTLDSALAAAERHPASDILIEAHEALGEAFAASGRTDSALHEFDMAALGVEHATLDLAADFDRAGYRERNLRPFDGALRLLLAARSRPRDTDELVRWLSRRNAAALALDASGAFGARPTVPGLEELKSRLDDNEVLLAYLVLDSTVSAVAVTRSGARVAQLPIRAAELSARVDAIRRPLVTTFSGRLDLVRARYSISTAAELYAALIEPFARELAGKRRLLIAPDGALHSLAFDALVAPGTSGMAIARTRGITTTGEPDYRRAQYLLDSFEVEYLPSPAFLRPRVERARDQRLDGLQLLAVGYEAPGSNAEIRALREVWPHGSFVALDPRNATESAVKARQARFGILHFAAHASADTHDPLASHLELMPDSLDDGLLHTTEIAATRTNAALVVLSACETSSGPIYSGEGAMGIARAFLAAGAHAVVATQWPVGAETAVLMREFYTRLARGEAPATALRGAKLMVRRSATGAHPVHWAGFELVR